MIYAVWVPLLLPLLAPLLAVPVTRRGAEQLAPRAAAWALTALALVLALSSTAALALLALAGALRLPFVARLGHLSPSLLGGGSAASGAVAALAAAVALTVLGGLVLHRGRRHLRELRAARRQAAGSGPAAGDLCVRQDDRPDAYALPGRPGHPGRIVVTTGMLRALTAPEREVLFAHERAHLTGRHHLFLAAGELAGALHPALRGLRTPLAYALERWADESAAEATGDRALTARAIARAALAAHSAPSAPSADSADRDPRRPRMALSATAGAVPRRVTALLGAAAPAGPALRLLPRALACLLLTCAPLSPLAAVDAAADLHGAIEIAQGESPALPAHR
ncbi:M56 family metallopeptidase [Streptomyces sp. NBC_01275]|uniref:M56 family metallopeptidase n=1 Tax=Streptomyces sp. NBC_01275 TaxID=2903807 RepID=UPI00225C293F|nr:M56 family metallopeptidase [Streptomyces sp. NBC_01275]MCX4759920.1 M56 family metallopeptidase [Streptomyces sp. NBC_01275]